MMNEKHRYEELADFLKTRRAKILPSQVGLSSATRRRTPSLRREEVAQLAGIGITWYTWLEQGRPIRVSTQVVESLSRVLMLDKQERIHLYLLTNQPLPADISGYQGNISPILQHVLDSLTYCPSLVTDQRWNVIGWNKAACLIFGNFTEMNIRDRNIVWAMFTDEKYKQLNHPSAGQLDFEVSNFDVSDNSGLKIIVHTPSPDTDTAQKMKSLYSLPE